MSKNRIAVTALGIGVSLAPLYAAAQQSGMNHGSMSQSQPGMMQTQAGSLADGEIRKVDKDAGKLTIKHGPIPSMDMPPMTMVYRVKDAGMLDKVKPGDKIKFLAENVGGAFTVTQIEPAP